MAGRGSQLKFVDQDIASQYRCIVCKSISRDPWRAQCCQAIYCQSCTKQDMLSTTASQGMDQSSSNGTPPVCCYGCEMDSPQFMPDKILQKKVGQLKAECPYAGCAWIGVLATAESHARLAHHSTAATALVYSNDPEILAAHSQPNSPGGHGVEQPLIPVSPPPTRSAETTDARSNKSHKMMGNGQEFQMNLPSTTHSRGLWKILTNCCKAGKPFAGRSASAKV